MRRLLKSLLLILLILPAAHLTARAQDIKNYRNEALGITFQYPANWTIREQIPAQTVTLASQADLDAVAAGKAPGGLLLSITISSFRQVGAQSIDDFGPILKKITLTPDLTP